MACGGEKSRFSEVCELELLIEEAQLLGRLVDVCRKGPEFVPINNTHTLREVASGNLLEPGFDLGNRPHQR